MRSYSLSPYGVLLLRITLAVFTLLFQLCHLLVNSCHLLAREPEALWDFSTTEPAVAQPSTVEQPLASWTLIVHSRPWFNDDYTTSPPCIEGRRSSLQTRSCQEIMHFGTTPSIPEIPTHGLTETRKNHFGSAGSTLYLTPLVR